MARARITKDEYRIEQYYGYGHGWEEVCAEDTRKEALARLAEYRENTNYPTRIRKVRVRIEAPTEGLQ